LGLSLALCKSDVAIAFCTMIVAVRLIMRKINAEGDND
jgi:hypothetical protein